MERARAVAFGISQQRARARTEGVHAHERLASNERRQQAARRVVRAGVASLIFVLAGRFCLGRSRRPGGAHRSCRRSLPRLRPRIDRAAPRPKAAIPPARSTADLVVLVSLDGLRPDAITPSMRALHKLYLQELRLTWHAPSTSRPRCPPTCLDGERRGPRPARSGLQRLARSGRHLQAHGFSVAHGAGLPASMFVSKNKLKHLRPAPRTPRSSNT